MKLKLNFGVTFEAQISYSECYIQELALLTTENFLIRNLKLMAKLASKNYRID